ncbi:hypothetical protein CRM22_004513 [Opisthorchis felineus]|uniref:Uncharacterized protein n=1 Tax=Opisthorchis felineus TaxID=147828 RepID=A0A4S2LVT6_OPIFE|nr:hypothetical protein CRM22_004513 [Opisthorchis felineus]
MSQSAALFGRPQQPQTKHLLQFKAGKMTINNENWVHADPRKGWVYVYQSGDGKLHFCWIDRKTCLVEDNFIISAQQAEFKRVPQCTTGRVYLLKVKNTKPFFVWMQEPNGKNDSNICSRINDYIASPPTQFTPPASDWLSNFGGFNQFSQNDLLALLTMGVGLGSGLSSESDVSSAQATAVTIGRHLNTGHLDSQTKPTTALGSAITTPQVTGTGSVPGAIPAKKGEGGKIQLQDLRNILSSISGPSKTSEPPIDLNDAVNMDSLRNLLEKPEVQARLLPHLPNRDPEAKPINDLGNLTENIRSSQFKSTLKSFSAAFQTGELAPVLSQFKLGSKADEAARRGDLVAFSQALEGNGSTASSSAVDISKPQDAQEIPKTGSEDDPKKDTSGSKPMDTD